MPPAGHLVPSCREEWAAGRGRGLWPRRQLCIPPTMGKGLSSRLADGQMHTRGLSLLGLHSTRSGPQNRWRKATITFLDFLEQDDKRV